LAASPTTTLSGPSKYTADGVVSLFVMTLRTTVGRPDSSM
jgi:hypothetical protein